MALKQKSEIELSEHDIFYEAILDEEKADPKVELLISVLWEALCIKTPFMKNVGRDLGMQLSRAAFALLVKFSAGCED